MNAKLWTTATLAFSAAIYAGCTNPPTTLNVSTGSGSGTGEQLSTGADSDGGGGASASGMASTGAGASGPTAAQAKAFFENTVFPELATQKQGTAGDQHACGDCHGYVTPKLDTDAPTWLGTTADQSYAIITQFPGLITTPNNSVLVLQGAHAGPALDPDVLTDVTKWLTMEAEVRGLGGGSGGGSSSGGTGGGSSSPLTLSDALDQYGKCMDYTVWQTPPQGTGLDKLPDMQTDSGVPCKSCHSDGLGGNWLSDNQNTTPTDPLNCFEKNQTYPYILKQVTGTVDEKGNFSHLVASKRWIDKGSESCDPTYTQCHPTFTLNQDMIDGINSFVSYTIGKFEMGNCMPMNPSP